MFPFWGAGLFLLPFLGIAGFLILGVLRLIVR
jgi:hypothetical protein